MGKAECLAHISEDQRRVGVGRAPAIQQKNWTGGEQGGYKVGKWVRGTQKRLCRWKPPQNWLSSLQMWQKAWQHWRLWGKKKRLQTDPNSTDQAGANLKANWNKLKIRESHLCHLRYYLDFGVCRWQRKQTHQSVPHQYAFSWASWGSLQVTCLCRTISAALGRVFLRPRQG